MEIMTTVAYIFGGITTAVGIAASIFSKVKVKAMKKSLYVLKSSASLHDRMLLDMVEAEQAYANYKDKGIDASNLKKEYVMNDLRYYALSNNLAFDENLWSGEVEHMISFSEQVNCKTKLFDVRNDIK